MTEYFYKLLAIALLVVMVVGAAAMGYEWNLAAHDRDKAQVALKVAQDAAEDLRGAIREQNTAVAALAAARDAVVARAALAQQVAAANGKHFDGALARIASAKATTCADAMPAVNQLLEAIR